MKLLGIDRAILFGFVVTLFFVPPTVFGQSEKLGAVHYTPVKGWKKTAKDNMVSFGDLNEATGKFCVISLYGATQSTGKPESDFVRDWNERVVKTLGAQGEPKTETEIADGWTMIAGGTPIDFQGTKAFVFLTVLSGHGKTVSILGLLNDDTYMPKLVAFNTGIEVDKTVVAAAQSTQTAPSQAPAAGAAAMNAGSLVREFEVNEIRAGQSYIGKVVRIYGTINSILVGKDGRIAITFKSTLGAYGNARCYFSPSQSSRVAELSAHTEATVQGTVRGWEGGYSGAKVFVLLENCTVP